MTDFTGARLPKQAPLVVGAIAVAIGLLGSLTIHLSPALAVVTAALAYLVLTIGWSVMVENRRRAIDRTATTLVWSAFVIALAPLLSLLWTVLVKGASQISTTFLTYSFFRTSLDQPVGIYHAVIGTLLITLFAALISVPVGIFAAIYLVEYGKGSRLARAVTFLVDVMTGIPSIVAGLFAFAMFTLILGPAYRSGLGGSVALSLLMIPIVVRSTEEMLRLVPNDLREAAYALGTPKWRTITKVVLPTALGGIITGVTLATARVIGETAPLLLIAGLTSRTNFNVFDAQMTTLPVLVYSQKSRGTPEDIAIAWGAALVLVVLVLVLNLLARVVGRYFAPKTGR